LVVVKPKIHKLDCSAILISCLQNIFFNNMANKERKHLRLRNWNYSSEGVYFITLCCNNRQSYFGQIQNNKVTLSMIGEIAS